MTNDNNPPPRLIDQFLPLQTGDKYMTPGVIALVESGKVTTGHLAAILTAHVNGLWGHVCNEDKEINDQAVIHGGRVLSAHPIDFDKPCNGHGPNCLWIITEHDRSATTILLPEEY